ncbi:MAG: SPOR domain-containing protein [Bacteroidales bacterium]|nr:SPOR domain-containing protein [Bacteroidales bacterium]
MKRILLIFAMLLATALLRAQDTTTVVVLVDSTLAGRDILSVMGPGAQVVQSADVRKALNDYVNANAKKPIQGYRIRVFYNSDPSSRTRSEIVAEQLRRQFPHTGVYRSFESPNYKVAIGDFRTKDEALRIFNAIKGTYPTAYIIKESIQYPR